MARKQVTSSKARQLKVQQLLIPEIEQLQQQELQAQQRLAINKPVMQIPRPAAKQSPKHKQKKVSNRLEAPYKKPTAKPIPHQLPNQQLVSGMNPVDNDILKKIKKLYKDDPDGYESDLNLMKERGETPQEWYDQMFDQVGNPAPQPKSRTVSFGNTTLVLPRDQHKLAALKDEALEYWKNLPEIR